MTKDDLMDALNDVEFDMVEDAEATTRQKRTKRWFPWAAAAAMFLCIVAAAVFSLNGKPSFPTESTAPTGNPGGLQPVRLALFKCAPTDNNMIILEKDIATPARMQIRVKNLQGLSAMEAGEIRAAERQYAEEKFEKYTANHSWSCHHHDKLSEEFHKFHRFQNDR